MNEQDLEYAISRGCKARAAGLAETDNPYLSREEMPAATGRYVKDWKALHDAWYLGWKIEDMNRSAG